MIPRPSYKEMRDLGEKLAMTICDALRDPDGEDDSFDAAVALAVIGMTLTSLLLSLADGSDRRRARNDFIATLIKSVPDRAGIKETRH